MERVVPETADMSLALLSLGAITRGWWRGNTPLILGCDDPQAYLEGWCFMGAIVGRIANRDSGAAFDLDGKRHGPKENVGPNQLDGGPGGLWNRSWMVEDAGPTKARLSCRSLDGEGDDPGAVDVVLSVTRGTDSLTCGMGTRPDRPTPLTLAPAHPLLLRRGGGCAILAGACRFCSGDRRRLVPAR
ncbi:MAG: hypothetical protein CML66_26685 [Rhodobacteraceae bacterium]|nr:hypothetical protein [Paracoccaceae bacterium]